MSWMLKRFGPVVGTMAKSYKFNIKIIIEIPTDPFPCINNAFLLSINYIFTSTFCLQNGE